MTADEIKDLCAWIESNQDATLADLAQRTGLSPSHLQRTFKAAVGISPRQYLENLRVNNFKSQLRDNPQREVTAAIYDAGFSSSSRIYEKTETHLGMTPMEYRGGGAGIAISYATAQTPLGLIMMAATDRGICFIQFGESTDALLDQLAEEYPRATLTAASSTPEFQQWMNSLNQYLSGQQTHLDLPLHIKATAFQMKVWKYLRQIPAGKVESYAEVAKGINQPKATRAVATACASNPVAIAIPCHRVIRSTGALGGYRWGLERKRILIGNEKRASKSPL